MPGVKILAISLLFSCSFALFNQVVAHNSNCNDLKADYEVLSSSEPGRFKVVIQVQGGTRPYHYVFLDQKGNLLSHDQTKNECSNLEKGTYRCIVVAKDDCKKELIIEIK